MHSRVRARRFRGHELTLPLSLSILSFRWLEQRLAECEDQLKQAVEEIVEMNRRERMLDEAVSEAEQASRNERVKLQMLAQEAQIKCDIIEKEKDALLQQLQSERLKRAELAQEIEATTREKGTAAREAAERETSMRAEVEALRKAKDDLEAAKKREVEELTKRCDNLESQLSQNLASFKFDVRNLRAKEKQIEEREEELELLQGKPSRTSRSLTLSLSHSLCLSLRLSLTLSLTVFSFSRSPVKGRGAGRQGRGAFCQERGAFREGNGGGKGGEAPH